jgi:hypothetical protein
VVLQDGAGALYTSNFGGWDGNTIYLKSDVADGLWNIYLLA